MAQQASTTIEQSATADSRLHESANANAAAQANRGGAQANGAAEATGSTGTAKISTGSAASASEDMRPVSGDLQGKLDSKSAKPGDPVILKTNDKVRAADGTVIPKGPGWWATLPMYCRTIQGTPIRKWGLSLTGLS